MLFIYAAVKTHNVQAAVGQSVTVPVTEQHDCHGPYFVSRQIRPLLSCILIAVKAHLQYLFKQGNTQSRAVKGFLEEGVDFQNEEKRI